MSLSFAKSILTNNGVIDGQLETFFFKMYWTGEIGAARVELAKKFQSELIR